MPPIERDASRGSSRATPLPLLAAAALLLVLRVVLGFFERSEAPQRADLVDWREPGPAAAAEARQTGKPVLYDFMAEWCGPCHVMQAELFANPTHAAKINTTYVPVRVMDRQREEGRNTAAVDSLQKLYKIRAFPTLVVASPDGSKHESLQGYRGGTPTMQWLAISSLEVTGLMKGSGSSRRTPGR